MRLAAALIGAALGALAATAALDTSFAGEAEEEVFDTPTVKEIAAKFQTLKTDELVSLRNRIQRTLDARFLAPPESAWKGFEKFRGRNDAGVARILQRGLFDKVVSPRCGGCYWSFTKRSNDYDADAQLELGSNEFRTGFAGGDTGAIVRLDGASLTTVTEESMPAILIAPIATYSGSRDMPGDVSSRIRGPNAEKGGVYGVRAVMWDTCDVLAAFQVIDLDDKGATIAWRLLKTYDVPKRKR